MIDIIQSLINDRLNEVHTSLPCKVVGVSYAKGTCTVQPLPKRELCGELVDYPPLIEVKLDFLKFGTWTFQIPRQVGDLVVVGFSEATESDKTSLERFSLNEPYIIGSFAEGFENNSDDIILSGNGTRLLIKGDGTIELTTGANQMTINSNIQVNGDINIKGNTNATGTVTGQSGVTGNGVVLETHTHKYKPGGGNPIPTQPPIKG